MTQLNYGLCWNMEVCSMKYAIVKFDNPNPSYYSINKSGTVLMVLGRRYRMEGEFSDKFAIRRILSYLEVEDFISVRRIKGSRKIKGCYNWSYKNFRGIGICGGNSIYEDQIKKILSFKNDDSAILWYKLEYEGRHL
jgi:hypothetical protein